MSENPYSDIFLHSSISEQIVQTPNNVSINYPWYYFNLTIVNELSSISTSFFQNGGAYLSIMVIFSFYVMSKSYLRDINKKAHHIATIFFFIFSGLGWLFFIQQNLSMLGESNYLDIIKSVGQATYRDTTMGQGPWLWLWFRPLTLGFTIFFAILYLMKQDFFSTRNYIIITSLLLLSLSQIHFPEFIIFIALIFLLGLFRPKLNLRLKETALSGIIASVLSILLVISYQSIFSNEFSRISIPYLLGLIFLSGLVFLITTYIKRPKITFRLNPHLITLILLSVYLGLFLSWLSHAENTPMDDITKISAVPLEFLPVLLGIVGAISIPGIILVLTKYRNNPVVLFVILLISALIFGRVITFLNAEYFNTGYWERRIIPYVFSSASILASLFILNILKNLSEKNRIFTPKNIVVISLLTTLVLIGILSTFLSVEYYVLILPEVVITDNERKLQGFLDNADPNSMVLTVTDRSRSIAAGSSFSLIPDSSRSHIWSSKNPEMSLEALSFFGNPTILYFNDYDLKSISKSEQGYIVSHFMPIAPIIYEGIEGKIYQLEFDSHPTSNSDLVLVYMGNKNNFYYAYDILSLGNYNYTTVLLSDINSLAKAKIIVTPDEYSGNQLIEYKKKYNLPFQKLIVFNLDSQGLLEDVNYSKSIINQTEIQFSNKFDKDLFVANKNYNPIAYHEDGNPFILSKTYEDFELFYFDLIPIINNLESPDFDNGTNYYHLSSLLDLIDVKLPIYHPVDVNQHSLTARNLASFKNMTFVGDTEIIGSSSILFLNNTSVLLNVDGVISELENVDRILPIKIDEVTLNNQGGVIDGGLSFYSKTFFNSTEVKFTGEPSKILFNLNNGDETIISGKNIQLNLSDSTILIRQPIVIIDGITKFTDFYSYRDLNKELNVLHEDILFQGKLTFKTKFSDEYHIILNPSFEGIISQIESKYTFDEIENLKNILNSLLFN